uniref:Exocyst component Exo84 C-terminal domain-containing protein n=1 Tax=Eutreptiella gymnastica TaxID=73025 RepID=A0A7S1J7V6_9EUGL|mmetsp:Transcript_74736/g.132000  ORF Transcript_74736/g.132000 Transcript_74736/m.132000 type:complete len:723 (+) Transcript_74736:75-2243(+)
MQHDKLGSFAKDAQKDRGQQQYNAVLARYRSAVAEAELRTPKAELSRELRGFAHDNFDVDRYLQTKMGPRVRTNRDTRLFMTHLVLLKEFAGDELHRKSYMSLPRLIKAAKLVRALETDLQRLDRDLRSLQKLAGQLSKVVLPLEDSVSTAATAPDAPKKAKAELVNDIDVAIFERNLQHAVDIFLRLQTERSKDRPKGAVPDMEVVEIEERLHTAVVNQIQGHAQSVSLVDSYLELLLKLDRPDEAADLFLQQRSTLLQDAVRTVRFMGDFVLYSKKCSSLFFIFLKLASNHYRKLFQNRKIATLLHWIVLETDRFAHTLRLQLFQGDVYRRVVRSLQIAFLYCQQLEHNLGVPIVGRFQGAFYLDICQMIDDHFAQVQQQVLQATRTDSFEAVDVTLPLPLFPTSTGRARQPTGEQAEQSIVVKISESCRLMYYIFQREVAVYVLNLQSPTLHLYELGFKRVTEFYLTYLHTHIEEKSRTDTQSLVSIANSLFVSEHMMPALIESLKKKFRQGTLHQLEKDLTMITKFPKKLIALFVDAKCQFVCTHQIKPDAGERQTVVSDRMDEGINVSRSMLRLILYLAELRPELNCFLGGELGQHALHAVVCALGSRFVDEDFWIEIYKQHYMLQGTYAFDAHLSLADTYQVIIDMEFFKCAFVNTLEEAWCTQLKGLESAILRRHLKPGNAERVEAECRTLASQVILKTLENDTQLYEAVQNQSK